MESKQRRKKIVSSLEDLKWRNWRNSSIRLSESTNDLQRNACNVYRVNTFSIKNWKTLFLCLRMTRTSFHRIIHCRKKEKRKKKYFPSNWYIAGCCILFWIQNRVTCSRIRMLCQCVFSFRFVLLTNDFKQNRTKQKEKNKLPWLLVFRIGPSGLVLKVSCMLLLYMTVTLSVSIETWNRIINERNNMHCVHSLQSAVRSSQFAYIHIYLKYANNFYAITVQIAFLSSEYFRQYS